jgi:dihydroorotate dehydrogenase
MLHLVSGLGQGLAMPVLRRLDPERAHTLAIRALRAGLAPGDPAPDDPRLAVRAMGMAFTNPIGLAAGFDKNAMALGPLGRAGFGLIEAGTVTPRPQPGNPRPRLFRLTEDRAVINRFGFNSEGIAAFVARLAARPAGRARVGANIGINKDSTTPAQDYAGLVAALVGHVDYITINVSSPNTPGLVRLQARDSLDPILAAIHAAVPAPPPLLVKLSPDLPAEALEAVVETAIAHQVAGLIVCNTTVERPADLRSAHAPQAGGLSGRPLFERSTQMLRQTAQIARGRLVLIGSGGIASGEDVAAKLRAGASLVQLYSELAYVGIRLVPRLKRELLAALARDGFANVEAAIGADL